MKTKEYVNKYKLNESDKFNHSEFVSDLTIDFLTLLEVGKAQYNLKGFDNAVRAIKMKFDAINNKTVGCIHEKLWNYFFATVIVKIREELFPVMGKRQGHAGVHRQDNLCEDVRLSRRVLGRADRRVGSRAVFGCGRAGRAVSAQANSMDA